MNGKKNPQAREPSLAQLIDEETVPQPTGFIPPYRTKTNGPPIDANADECIFGGTLAAPEYEINTREQYSSLDEETIESESLTRSPRANSVRLTVLPENGLLASSTRLPTLTFNEQQRYVFQRAIGSGSMGLVNLAVDSDIQRLVAVKTLRRSKDPAAVARMTDEIRIAGRLEHPNIVPVHDVGLTEGGDYFFVMRFVSGVTLREVIDGLTEGNPLFCERFSIAERLRVFRDIAVAVAFAHAEGTLHQDLKPENLMVGDHGEVFVMDWGLADYLSESDSDTLRKRLARQPTAPEASMQLKNDRASLGVTSGKTKTIQGTPLYMSPEQTRGDSGMAGEIYTLCVILHELLGLNHYLSHRSGLKAILRGVRSDPVPSLFASKRSNTNKAIPIEWSHFIAKGISKRPSERFETVHDLVEAFNQVDEGRFPVECPTSLTKRGLRGLLRAIDRFPLLGYAVPLAIIMTLAGMLTTALLN
jgi:eukaryotic-like serine/threonine-protein kinase